MENGNHSVGGEAVVIDNDSNKMKIESYEKDMPLSQCPLPTTATTTTTTTTTKPRLLCLHGIRSSPAITTLQLGNLGIDRVFDVDHLPGRLKTGDTVFSWFESGADEDEIYEACEYILSYVNENGPYEAVYGFSQGAFLVTLLSSSHFRAQLGTTTTTTTAAAAIVPPWEFCILACAAVSATDLLLAVDEDLPSFHLIGTNDPFKPNSDAIVDYYHSESALVVYRDIGHEVPRGTDLSFEIIHWYQQQVDASAQEMLDPAAVSTLPIDLISITNFVNAFVEDSFALAAGKKMSPPSGPSFKSRASMFFQGKGTSMRMATTTPTRGSVVTTIPKAALKKPADNNSDYSAGSDGRRIAALFDHADTGEADGRRRVALFDNADTGRRPSLLNQGTRNISINKSFPQHRGNIIVPGAARRSSTTVTPGQRRKSTMITQRRSSTVVAQKRGSMFASKPASKRGSIFASKPASKRGSMFAPKRGSMFVLQRDRSKSSLSSRGQGQILQVDTAVQLALNNYDDTLHENLMDVLEDAEPDRVALYAPGAEPLTYARLLDFMSTEGDLRLLGLKQDSVVAYLAPVTMAVAFLTIAAQCTAAPLDPSLSKADVGLALEQIKPDILIIFHGVNAEAGMAAAAEAGIEVAHAELIPETVGLFRFLNKKECDISGATLENLAGSNGLILRTSGTTSKPKVVPLKMSSIVANAKAIAQDLGLTSNDIALNAMPLFHIGGLSANLLSSLVVGAGVILLPRFNVTDFVDHIFAKDVRPTWYSAVPTMHAAIQHVVSSEESSKHSLRFIRTGADAMSVELAMHLEATLGVGVVLTYSMTEQMPISQPPTGYRITQKKPGSVGRPVTTSLCVVDEQLLPIPYRDSQGEILSGEICISGPTIMEGYLNNAAANADSFFKIGGKVFFRTGDVGHIDKDAFLFLTSRKKELIKRGGEQISPVEVEEACMRFPRVKLCVCFAIKDAIWGERVGAAIILEEHVPPEWKKVPFLFVQLREFLRQEGLADYKLPEEIHIVTVEQLKKTSSGKYVRIGLAEHLGLIAKEEFKPMSPHNGAAGVRFMLALGVMYVHIGRLDYLRDGWSHSRTWCIHTPLFFFIGGFVLSSGTKTVVTKRRDLMEFYRFRVSMKNLSFFEICFRDFH